MPEILDQAYAALLDYSAAGVGNVNGSETSFTISVKEVAEPGARRDKFAIQLGTGYSRSRVLQRGNIQIHQEQKLPFPLNEQGTGEYFTQYSLNVS